MKLLTTLPLAFTTLSQISAQNENSEDGSPGTRRFNSIVSMTYTQITTAFDRSEFESRISKYGCHCFPENHKGPGHQITSRGAGAPVDDIDSLCRKLGKCHKCINIEFGNGIDVDDAHYHWEVAGDGSIDCSKNNNDRLALCQCDRQFANELSGIWDDANHNGFYWKNNRHARNNPTFDKDATCVPNGNLPLATHCCGSFPHVIPYSNTDRQCCVVSGKIYNAIAEECCVDGSISGVGTC